MYAVLGSGILVCVRLQSFHFGVSGLHADFGAAQAIPFDNLFVVCDVYFLQTAEKCLECIAMAAIV